MRTTGTYISAVGHVGLIGWLLLGWGLSSDPLEFDTMTVTTVSGEEFDALQAAASTPDPGTEEPTAPVQPVTDTAPPPPTGETPTEVPPPPDPVTPPVDETPPPDPPPAAPVADVTDVPPVDPTPPAPAPSAPDLEVSDTPTPERADIVAPTPNAPPPPDAQVDDVVSQEAVPDPSAEPEVEIDPQPETAPEVTAPEIVIEDERPSGAVETSMRPAARPRRPAPPVQEPVEDVPAAEVETPTPAAPETDDAVAAALAAALAGSEAPAVAAGPPMTGSEKDAFRVAINNCWNIDPGSEAARVTVRVVFELGRDGKVIGNPRLISGSGGTDASINVAFEAARRAILRCQGAGGYQLPEDKYEEWREVTANFDASGARY